MVIKTSDSKLIKSFTNNFYLPPANSHKGKNGKILIIGGSSLFHSASLWAAEVTSHFVDIVHYSSTIENNQVFLSLKKKFHNGIVVSQKDILNYVKEDDSVLIGPGMVRGECEEAKYTRSLTKSIIENYPEKKIVIDAGALQMMDKTWLLKLKTQAIITPHQKEFEKLFGINITKLSLEKKQKQVTTIAKEYRITILLKAVVDIISDGEKTIIIDGGNAGLTKGGSGDVLAGLATAFYAKNNPITSAVLASYFLKKTSEELFKEKGYWYNISDIIGKLPSVMEKIVL